MAIHHKDATFSLSIFKNNVKTIWTNYIDPSHKEIIRTIVILNTILLVFNIAIPMVIGRVVDDLRLSDGNVYPLLLSNGYLLILSFLSIGLYIWSQTKSARLIQILLNKMRFMLIQKVFATKKAIIEEIGSAKVFERFIGDCWEISSLFSKTSTQCLQFLTQIGIYIAIALLNRSVFVLCLVWLVVSCVVCYYQIQGIDKTDKQFRESKETVFKKFKDRITNSCFVKMLNDKHYKAFSEECLANIQSSQEKAYELSMKETYLDSTMDAICTLMWISGVLYAGVLCFHGEISVGCALALLVYFNRGQNIYITGSNIYDRVRSANLAISRVLELSDNDDNIEEFGTKNIENVKGEIEFKNISFSYGEKQIFNNMSLHINPGDVVYLIGKSGLGKSTLFNLLTKMDKVDKGAIFIDGYEISSLDRNFRGHIYYDFQRPAIFTGSVMDNFRIINPDVTDTQVEMALTKVGLESLIPKIHDEESVLENGFNLSGGEARRFVMARALISDAKILLFDEPTANLDENSKRQILELIESLSENHTIIVIAHQLKQNDIRQNVRVVEMDGNGGVREQ